MASTVGEMATLTFTDYKGVQVEIPITNLEVNVDLFEATTFGEQWQSMCSAGKTITITGIWDPPDNFKLVRGPYWLDG